MGKSKQKISNWKLYNLALVKRGSLTLWMDEQAIKHWHCQTHHGRRGRGFHYSDRAIDTALVHLGQVGLALADELRLEGGVTVARRLDGDLSVLAF